MRKVAVIVGSLRAGSLNRRFAEAVAKLGQDRLAFEFVEIGDLPLYNQELEAELPAAVQAMKAQIAACDAVFFVTPEYNRSIPGVLKNAIDWGSRPPRQGVWGDKPCAIGGITPGPLGTAAAQAHLRSIVTALGMALLGAPALFVSHKPDMFGEDGLPTDPAFRTILETFIDRFDRWIGKLA